MQRKLAKVGAMFQKDLFAGFAGRHMGCQENALGSASRGCEGNFLHRLHPYAMKPIEVYRQPWQRIVFP